MRFVGSEQRDGKERKEKKKTLERSLLDPNRTEQNIPPRNAAKNPIIKKQKKYLSSKINKIKTGTSK